jgi:hypothetical protein
VFGDDIKVLLRHISIQLRPESHKFSEAKGESQDNRDGGSHVASSVKNNL